jgi:hypothetical protein
MTVTVKQLVILVAVSFFLVIPVQAQKTDTIYLQNSLNSGLHPDTGVNVTRC